MKTLNKGEGSNRFRYQSFRERVETLQVTTALRKVGKQGALDEIETSYFHDALTRWRDLNLSATYKEFIIRVLPLSNSLAQLLYHQKDIVDLLDTYITRADSLALEPLLDLTTMLAKDLQSEFYPFYPRLLRSILDLLRFRDVQVVEWTFHCIAYLYKFLANDIVLQPLDTYRMISPYLGAQEVRSYIRRFTAQSFAYLLRRTRGKPLSILIAGIMEDVRLHPSTAYVEGVAELFFEAVRSVDHHLHSRTAILLRDILAS
ncbi:hypothetical protein BJ684DRAFT_8007, partial [Piptocephalis cylindrospora]